MLNCTFPASADAAGGYYGKSSNELETVGSWHGKEAERLGLSGPVDLSAFKALLRNRTPEGGKLTPRDRDDRRCMLDITVSPPKSVCVMAALVDPRIVGAVQAANADMMRLVESRAATRVRRFQRQERQETGRLLWVDFTHRITRAQDPGLHIHNAVLAVTSYKGKPYSPEFDPIVRSSGLLNAAFNASLAFRLKELGYGIVKTKDAFEIEGVPPRVLKEFSRRQEAINDAAMRRNIRSPKGRAAIAAYTRQRKRDDLRADKLYAEWIKRLTPAEFKTLGSVTSRIQDAMKDEIPLGPTLGKDSLGKALGKLAEAMADREARQVAAKPEDARTPLQRALAGMLEEMSAVPEEKLLTEALKQGVGEVTLEGLQAELESGDFARAKIGDVAYVTTRETMTAERDLRTFATREAEPLIPATTRLNWSVPDDPLQKAAELSPAEKASCEHALRSTTQVTLLRTKKGKERAAVEGMVKRGLEKAGHTVAQLDAATLDGETLKRQGKVDVLIVANAEQLKFGDAVQISQLPNSPRMILSGSLRDYRKPERGQVMSMLEDLAGLKSSQERPKAKLAEKAARVSRQWAEKVVRSVRGMHRWNTLEQHRERTNALGQGTPTRNRERQLER